MSDPLAPPKNPFDVYIPTAENPFNTKRLAHLLRRTAFTLTADRLDKFTAGGGKSPSEILDWLFTYDPENDPLNPLLDQMEGLLAPFNKPEAAQQWWVYRLLKSPRPLQEKIALLWHNHFATAVGKGDNGQMPMRMHSQIDLFRRLGLANFRELALEVGRNPAMLVWLDGQFNRKGKPNENYGRELQELFTLGIGNYTESDVKEVARAYTGWRIKDEKGVLDPKAFDDGEKEIYGKKGNFNDEAVVDLILSQPACPKHIASRLLREFVHPNPTAEMIEHYAARLVETKWELKPVVREMLSSNLFFSDWAYRSKIKSPAELVTGSLLAITAMGGKASIEYALKAMISMGQPIMNPPSVKGWDGEETWINANTLFLRYNFAAAVANQKGKEFTRKSDLKTFLEKRDLTTADKIVDHFATIFLDGQLPEGLKEKLTAFMATTVKGKPAPFTLTADSVHTKVRSVLNILMATPEYQLS